MNVLVAAPGQVHQDDRSVGKVPGKTAGVRYRVRRLERGQNALETVTLKKAYAANPTEFMRQSSADLQGVLPFIAMYYDEKKNYAEADTWIRRALDATPNDSEMRIEFAAVYLQREPPQPDKSVQ